MEGITFMTNAVRVLRKAIGHKHDICHVYALIYKNDWLTQWNATIMNWNKSL